MTMPIMLPREPAHTCPLPWKSGGYGSTGFPDGTLFVCPECDLPWVSRPCYEHYGNTSRWHPVRWWHWRLKKRLVEGHMA